MLLKKAAVLTQTSQAPRIARAASSESVSFPAVELRAMDRRASLSKRLRTTATQLPPMERNVRKRIAADLRLAATKLDKLERYVASVRRIADRLDRRVSEIDLRANCLKRSAKD